MVEGTRAECQADVDALLNQPADNDPGVPVRRGDHPMGAEEGRGALQALLPTKRAWHCDGKWRRVLWPFSGLGPAAWKSVICRDRQRIRR